MVEMAAADEKWVVDVVLEAGGSSDGSGIDEIRVVRPMADVVASDAATAHVTFSCLTLVAGVDSFGHIHDDHHVAHEANILCARYDRVGHDIPFVKLIGIQQRPYRTDL